MVKTHFGFVVTCHRVTGTDGSLTGYVGGLWCKKWLLEHETHSYQQSLFLTYSRSFFILIWKFKVILIIFAT